MAEIITHRTILRDGCKITAKKGDVVKYVSKGGELMDGEIEAIIPMTVRGVLDLQYMFIHPRTGMRRQYMFSDIRIEYIISKFEEIADDATQDSKRFYYILCR